MGCCSTKELDGSTNELWAYDEYDRLRGDTTDLSRTAPIIPLERRLSCGSTAISSDIVTPGSLHHPHRYTAGHACDDCAGGAPDGGFRDLTPISHGALRNGTYSPRFPESAFPLRTPRIVKQQYPEVVGGQSDVLAPEDGGRQALGAVNTLLHDFAVWGVVLLVGFIIYKDDMDRALRHILSTVVKKGSFVHLFSVVNSYVILLLPYVPKVSEHATSILNSPLYLFRWGFLVVLLGRSVLLILSARGLRASVRSVTLIMARQSRHIATHKLLAHYHHQQQQQQQSRKDQRGYQLRSGALPNSTDIIVQPGYDHHRNNGQMIPTSDSSSDPHVPDDRLQSAHNLIRSTSNVNPNFRQRMAVLCEMADADTGEQQQQYVSNNNSSTTTTPTNNMSELSPSSSSATPGGDTIKGKQSKGRNANDNNMKLAVKAQSNKINSSAIHRYCERLRHVPHYDSFKPPRNTWRLDDGPVYARFVEDTCVIDHEVATLEHFKNGQPLKYPLGPLMINGSATYDPAVVQEFETPLFKGKIVIRAANLPSSSRIDYFTNKKRLTQCIVQGKFKQKGMYFHEVFSGFENKKPWQNLPSKFMFSLGMGVVKKLIPVIVEDLAGERPYFLTPLVSSCQTLHVANPLETDDNKLKVAVPNILDPNIGEDTRLLGGKFMNDEKLSRNAASRKRFYSSVSNLFDYSFDPELVYTIDVYQHLLSYATYCYDVVVAQLDLRHYLDGQPLEHTTLYNPHLAQKFFGADESTNSSKDKLQICGRHFWRVQFLHQSLGR
eukprot:Lankesteria_metandrocarpae@DN10547_c0_g1_i1.p1